MSLSWTASTDNVGVTGYNILRNGVQIGTSTTTSYTDNSVASNTAYTYTVIAYDAAGIVSTPSNSAPATTPKEQCPCSIWQDGTPTGSLESNDPERADAWGAVPGRQQRIHHRGAVLQGARRYRRAYRELVEFFGAAAGQRDVH